MGTKAVGPTLMKELVMVVVVDRDQAAVGAVEPAANRHQLDNFVRVVNGADAAGAPYRVATVRVSEVL